MKIGGGHFAPKLGGQFELESGGHFKLELGGQYHWNLQAYLVVIEPQVIIAVIAQSFQVVGNGIDTAV